MGKLRCFTVISILLSHLTTTSCDGKEYAKCDRPSGVNRYCISKVKTAYKDIETECKSALTGTMETLYKRRRLIRLLMAADDDVWLDAKRMTTNGKIFWQWDSNPAVEIDDADPYWCLHQPNTKFFYGECLVFNVKKRCWSAEQCHAQNFHICYIEFKTNSRKVSTVATSATNVRNTGNDVHSAATSGVAGRAVFSNATSGITTDATLNPRDFR